MEDALNVLLVCGSPEPSSPETVAALVAAADAVVAVDRGLDYCLAAGMLPQRFCGDADTVSAESLEQAKAASVPCEFHTPHKDMTDLELAFCVAEELAEAAGRPLAVTLTCAAGGKPDHALAVFGVAARHASVRPRIAEDGFECRILSAEGQPAWRLPEHAVGSRFSEIALSEPATFSLEGFEWSWPQTTMRLLDDRGISNVVRSPDAEIVCMQGVLAAFLFEKQPDSC